MFHVFIEEERNGFSIKAGDMVFHVNTYEQATELAIKVGQALGKIGY